MASASSSGFAEREHMDMDGQGCEVNALRNQPAGPLHDCMQDIPRGGVSTTTALEPSSRLQFLATWLLGYLRYTCDILAYLSTCLPSTQVDQRHEEATVTSYGVNLEPGVLIVDNSNVAESEHRVESKHKVFLSHSGGQKDFVEQLCIDLERCDRYPFFDKLRSSLPIGEKFPKLIFDAIEQCHVGVVVLSEEFFVRSKWPMLELNSMVKEFEKPNPRIRIIPVFYLISINALTDPKNQSRWTSKWEEWALNDKRISVTEWKRALRALGSINGLTMKKGYGDVKFREEIVSVVCGLVPPETRWDDSHVQGRLRTCKVILDKMEEVSINSRVPIVGLYGVGGMGKTTICKALCNNLTSKFCDNVCHIELGSGNEMELLQKALKTLTNIRHDLLDKLNDIGEGYVYLKREVQNHSLFLALDNIQDDYKSMEIAQTYLEASYGCGSFILVTARSLDVLKMLNLEEMNCLEMPELEEDEARSLFLHYVNLPLENQIDEVYIKDCMKQCYFVKGDGKNRHYHPLALKVLGRQLGWNAKELPASLKRIKTFNKLSNMEHPIFSILRNAFDTLMPIHQLLFMDLALFMAISEYNCIDFNINKWDWMHMVYGERAENMGNMLQVLKRKSLVEDVTDDFSIIGIHDLWIEFAVAETKAQDSTNQRWVYQVDGKRAALGRRGRCRESVDRMCFLNEGWKGLNGLNLDDFVNVEAFKLDVEIHMADCALDLDLSGLKHLKSLWVTTLGLTVRADGLKSLRNLCFLLWKAPGFSPWLNEIGHFTNLQFLGLGDCKGVEVVDVTELKVLRVLMMRKFPDLITVTGLSSRLAGLQRLRIIICGSLRECPGVGELYALEELDLMYCGKLEELPCLGRLTKLRRLDIRECQSIRAVPGLSDLVALERLDAMGCSELAMLPDLGKLTKLQVLFMGPAVRGVLGLDGLISLTTLHASFGKLLGEQPVFSKLLALETMDIRGWNGSIWTSIRSLLMLGSLRLTDCRGEDVVPDLQNLERLKSVVLFDCDVKDLSGLSNLTELEALVIHGCAKLETLPEFERLTKLTDLRIRGCDNLSGWPCASDLCSLQWLSLDGFSWMKMMPGLQKLTGLRELELWGQGCENALGMASLSQLQRLYINELLTSEALDFSNFPQLKELWLGYCSGLKRVTCSKPLTALNELKVYVCASLEEMPDLSMFPQLEVLKVYACSALKRLACSELLAHMKEINLCGCDQVQKLDLSRFPKLKVFSQEGFLFFGNRRMEYSPDRF